MKGTHTHIHPHNRHSVQCCSNMFLLDDSKIHTLSLNLGRSCKSEVRKLPLGARTLLGAPGCNTRNKNLLGAPGIATRRRRLEKPMQMWRLRCIGGKGRDVRSERLFHVMLRPFSLAALLSFHIGRSKSVFLAYTPWKVDIPNREELVHFRSTRGLL